MLTINIDNAKSKLAQIVKRVEKGETIEFTREGKPFAKMVPSKPANKKVSKAIKKMEVFQRKGPTLGPGLTLKQLLEESRKR